MCGRLPPGPGKGPQGRETKQTITASGMSRDNMDEGNVPNFCVAVGSLGSVEGVILKTLIRVFLYGIRKKVLLCYSVPVPINITVYLLYNIGTRQNDVL